MPLTLANGLNINYETRGSGPRLLYISGSSGDLREHPNAFDTPLAEHFTVLAYDQRGLGQTDTPPGPYTMADYAADADALLAALGWDQCHVIGHSFGGMVAQEVAIRYPQRVDRLVLSATSSGGAGGSSYPVETLAALEPAERLSTFIALRDTRQSKSWQEANPEAFQEVAKQVVAEFGSRGTGEREGSKLQLGARKGHDVFGRLAHITAPVLVGSGAYDGIAPPRNMEATASQLANATFASFNGGHFFLNEDPAAYPRVIEFLTV